MIAVRGKTGYDQIRDEASKCCKILFYTPEGNTTGSMGTASRPYGRWRGLNEGWWWCCVHICRYR